jgi:creatinine amidohydrolase
VKNEQKTRAAKEVTRRRFIAGAIAAGAGLAIAQAASEQEEKTAVKKWRYEYMRPDDLAEAIKERPVAWVVFSPLEWHGQAMSFATDPFMGQMVADSAWEKVGGVRIPTIYVGAETDYKYWGEKGLMSHWGMELNTHEHNPGSLYVRPITLQLVVEDYLYFLQREGFRVVVVSTGHGGTEHVKVLEDVCGRYEKGPMKVLFWHGAGGDKMPAELRFEGSGGHADFGEASMIGGLDPNMVDKSKFGVIERDRKVKILKENVDKINFEKGRKILEFSAKRLEEEVSALLKKMGY